MIILSREEKHMIIKSRFHTVQLYLVKIITMLITIKILRKKNKRLNRLKKMKNNRNR